MRLGVVAVGVVRGVAKEANEENGAPPVSPISVVGFVRLLGRAQCPVEHLVPAVTPRVPGRTSTGQPASTRGLWVVPKGIHGDEPAAVVRLSGAGKSVKFAAEPALAGGRRAVGHVSAGATGSVPRTELPRLWMDQVCSDKRVRSGELVDARV